MHIPFHRARKRGAAALGAIFALSAWSICSTLPAAAATPEHERPNAVSNQAPALEFHVSLHGHDFWPGTAARPFKTIKAAQAAVRRHTAHMSRDIIVNIHPGTHVLNNTLILSNAAGDSGSNGHQVIYQAYRYGTAGQAHPTISGGRDIDGWRLVDPAKNVWRAEVGRLETRQLYINGKRATRTSLDHGLPTLTRTPDGYITSSALPTTWANPTDLEFVYAGVGGSKWPEPRCGVDSITPTSSGTSIKLNQPCLRRAAALFEQSPFGAAELQPTSIQNSKTFLDKPGTFYLDRSHSRHHSLFYIPRPGENLRHDLVVAPVLESLVAGSGTDSAPLHDVTFRGLQFSDATWLKPNEKSGFVQYIGGLYEEGENPTLGVTLSPQAQSMPGNVNFRRSNHITFERNRFQRLGAQALEVVGSDNVIRGNTFTDVSGGAILLGDDRPSTAGVVSKDDLIENNWIHGIGAEYHGSTGIYATRTTDATIAHNQLNDLPYTGIFLGQGHEQKIRANGPQDLDAPRNTGGTILDNRVFDVMKVMTDGGGIYTTFKQGTSFESGATIRGNVVTDILHPWWGIYTDWGSSWMKVSDNVIHDVYESTGGCSLPSLNAGIAHMRFTGNYWINDAPNWLCGPPVGDIELADNTLLPAQGASAACQANADCEAIVSNAGLEDAYRDLL